MISRLLLAACVAGLAASAACVGCAGSAASASRVSADTPLTTTPLTALAPAAALTWLLDVRPRALLGDATLAPALRELVSDETFAAFSRVYAVDLREAEEVTVAGYPSTRLFLVGAFLDPTKLEAAFKERVLEVEGRGVDHEGSPTSRIVRTWGTQVGGDRMQLAIFGRQAAGLEVGRLGPLRASEGFAQGKLHRAAPALGTAPLSTAAAHAGDAPVRLFVPGPFDVTTAQGLGGLLGGASAAVITLARGNGPDAAAVVEVQVLLSGFWTDDPDPAGALLLRQFHALVTSPTGKLIGADATLEPPTVATTPETLVLTARYDAQRLARRLHLAVEGPLTALLSPGEKRAH